MQSSRPLAATQVDATVNKGVASGPRLLANRVLHAPNGGSLTSAGSFSRNPSGHAGPSHDPPGPVPDGLFYPHPTVDPGQVALTAMTAHSSAAPSGRASPAVRGPTHDELMAAVLNNPVKT